MTAKKKTIRDPDLARVEAALIRAGKRAREIARKTRTPLVIYKNGKIKKYRIYNRFYQRGAVMITGTEIKTKGIQLLTQHLGLVEAERFIALIQREPFDYTKWRQGLDEDLSIEEISRKAMSLREKSSG